MKLFLNFSTFIFLILKSDCSPHHEAGLAAFNQRLDKFLPFCMIFYHLLLNLFFFKYLFIYLFLAALGLHCCAWAFSSCGERGLLLAVMASLVMEHGLLGVRASVVVAYGLSCSMACGIFLDQDLNPCPLRWQADS